MRRSVRKLGLAMVCRPGFPLVMGWAFVEWEGRGQTIYTWWAIVPLLGAVLVRCGIAPFHVWMTDLFERAKFSTHEIDESMRERAISALASVRDDLQPAVAAA